eukprot:4190489-Pyramimonas_sp.AAC.1
MSLMTTFPLASCRRAPDVQSRGLAHHQFGTARLMEALKSRCNISNARKSSENLRVWAKISETRQKLERKQDQREETRELEERTRVSKEEPAPQSRKRPPSVAALTTCEPRSFQ